MLEAVEKTPPEANPSSIDSSYVHYNDYYHSELSQQVVIRCGPKAVHVESVLSEPVEVVGRATWSRFIQALEKMGGGNIVTLLDFLGSSVGKGRLRQPWMSRKVWQGSEPLKLTLNLRFLTTGGTFAHKNVEYYEEDSSAFLEVYHPTCQLMSLVYPGGVGEGKGKNRKMTRFVPPGPSAFHSFHGEDSMEGQKSDISGVNVGHHVDVTIGSFIQFQSCFVTDCSVRYSPTLDARGYPTSASVVLFVESFEEPFVDLDAASALTKGKPLKDAIDLPFTFFKLNQQTGDMAHSIAKALVDMAQISEDSTRWFFGSLLPAVVALGREQSANELKWKQKQSSKPNKS